MLYAVEIPCMGFYNMPVPFLASLYLFNYHTARHIEKRRPRMIYKKMFNYEPSILLTVPQSSVLACPFCSCLEGS